MKFDDFILKETLGIAARIPYLDRKILNSIQRISANFYNKNLTKLYFYPLRRDPYFEPRKAQVESNTQTLADHLAFRIENLLKKYIAIYWTELGPYKVKFSDFEGEDLGKQIMHEIEINYITVYELAKSILDRMNDLFIGNGYAPTPAVASDFPASSLNTQAINNITGVFDHELAHAVQRHRAGNFYYTSYIERDPSAFLYKIINDIATDEEYIASPDEIGAFAAQEARLIISNINALPKAQRAEALNQALKNLRVANTRYSEFKENVPEKYHWILNRFLKRIYQELYAYQDSVKLT